jgi:hypothetical protein
MHNHGVQYRNNDHEMTKGASGCVCAWWLGPQPLDRRRWHASVSTSATADGVTVAQTFGTWPDFTFETAWADTTTLIAPQRGVPCVERVLSRQGALTGTVPCVGAVLGRPSPAYDVAR